MIFAIDKLFSDWTRVVWHPSHRVGREQKSESTARKRSLVASLCRDDKYALFNLLRHFVPPPLVASRGGLCVPSLLFAAKCSHKLGELPAGVRGMNVVLSFYFSILFLLTFWRPKSYKKPRYAGKTVCRLFVCEPQATSLSRAGIASLAFLVSLLFLLHTPFCFSFHGAFNTAFHAMEQEYENGIFYIGFCLYTVVDRKFI